ncbi:MAG: peptide chain release factor N(5)-glutamine methyltransferase [Mesorhizobium sp.]
MTTLTAIYRLARKRLTDAGVETAALDARLLVAHVTGHTLEDIICRPMEPVSAEISARLDDLLSRRTGGETVHRIIGAREFFGLRLGMSAETLEPRSDTEALVELVLEPARRFMAERGRCRILDLGTGTGAIGLALVHEVPGATAVLTDVSEDALATARANAEALGLGDRVELVTSDWLAGVTGTFELIVSNPPYIKSGDIGGLTTEVRLFDPMRALDGGADGLGAYRVIAKNAGSHLADGGLVGLEIGMGQGDDLRAIFNAVSFDFVASARDLAGIERALLFSVR